MYDLYVVTDRKLSNGRSHEEIAELSYLGGADVVQLREKDVDGKELYKTAVNIKRLAKEYGKMFIVNDRIDIALASDADGVHIGQTDIPLKAARSIVPDDFIIGVSVSSVNEAIEAEKHGADYIVLSPIFSTSSKNDAGDGKGLNVLRDIKNSVKIPVLAIGGINSSNVFDVLTAGADGVAVISAVISQSDVKQSVADLKKMISDAKIKASKVRL